VLFSKFSRFLGEKMDNRDGWGGGRHHKEKIEALVYPARWGKKMAKMAPENDNYDLPKT